MQPGRQILDAVVVGGGFYGVSIAAYLARKRGFRRVMLVERESALLTRASYNNQARVHNGYHYPRSFTTAFRSQVNSPRFMRDWPRAVRRDFTALYAVARRNSKVTARQFEHFCREIGASFRQAEPTLLDLFEPRLIENVYRVEEAVFDAGKLARWAEQELQEAGVRLLLQRRVTSVSRGPDGTLRLALSTHDGNEELVSCRYAFNCTYSALNQIAGDFRGTRTSLKQEITELALVLVPPALRELSITVMDGPFFSVMPFPARTLHTLSHVRYTPHVSWIDQQGIGPYERLESYERSTRFDRMIRDAARYMPVLRESEYVDSLYEVKTVLVKNEGDDGRPILFEKHRELPGCYSVLGGKIDNIYDVLDILDQESLQPEPVH